MGAVLAISLIGTALGIIKGGLDAAAETKISTLLNKYNKYITKVTDAINSNAKMKQSIYDAISNHDTQGFNRLMSQLPIGESYAKMARKWDQEGKELDKKKDEILSKEKDLNNKLGKAQQEYADISNKRGQSAGSIFGSAPVIHDLNKNNNNTEVNFDETF